MRWQGSRRRLIIWWQMIVIRGLLSYGRKLGYENIKVKIFLSKTISLRKSSTTENMAVLK